MGPDEVLEKLAAILPGFGSHWDEPSNDHRGDDGSFTPCGAFAEATAFVRERYETLTGPQLDELSQFVEACMTPPGTPLGDAAATCFLENLTIRTLLRRLANPPPRRGPQVLPGMGRDVNRRGVGWQGLRYSATPVARPGLARDHWSRRESPDRDQRTPPLGRDQRIWRKCVSETRSDRNVRTMLAPSSSCFSKGPRP